MSDNLHLDKAKNVPFDKLYLDPNNPRLGREQPGYEDPALIFDPAAQQDLETRIQDLYEIKELVEAIVSQGWVPIDAILVWEHPKKKGYYVVAEGNSRTTALREIRKRLATLQHSYEQKKKKKNADQQVMKELEEEIQQLNAVVEETNEISVFPIKAANTKELVDRLPRLLGVRHIQHVKQWKPYSTNLYIANLYKKLFHQHHGGKAALRLDTTLIKKVGAIVSLSPTKTKRNIQAALAFSHFKERFEDRLPGGELFRNDDQYFFEILLVNRYPRKQFRWSEDNLHLDLEMEEVLFKWAFERPRPKKEDNPNIFYEVENIRLWQKMSNYDDKNKTSFATRLDVTMPDTATPMRELEADFLSAQVRQSPVVVMNQLLTALRTLEAGTMRSQSSHLVPVIKEVMKVGNDCLLMMKAVS